MSRFGQQLPPDQPHSDMQSGDLSQPVQADFFSLTLQRLDEQTREMVQSKSALHAATSLPETAAYILSNLKAAISSVLELPPDLVRIASVERGQFGADLSVQVPSNIASLGAKEYAQSEVPALASKIRNSFLVQSGLIEDVSTKGLYVNLRFGPAFYEAVINQIRDLGRQFGTNTDLASERIVVDFSSPNTAKRLHAGHIRSTIVGNVLSNLYEACGALVFKDNHINDWGGFGFILEGWDRWQSMLPEKMEPGEKLIALYGIRRAGETAAESPDTFAALGQAEIETLRKYFGAFTDHAEFSSLWNEYKQRSDVRFAQLERGDKTEVDLWSQLVQYSVADFGKFYNTLRVHFDCILGESFYARRGEALVQELVASGLAHKFSPEDFENECARLEGLVKGGEMSAPNAEILKDEARQDIGAYIIEIEPGRRLVALRSDGRTIYSSRDLATLEYRMNTFQPTKVIYVVGQEQQRHFEDVFGASRLAGLVPPDGPELKHLYFGFYTEAQTGKKLSSREGAQGVIGLLEGASKYFHTKISEREVDPADAQSTAEALAVGSVVLNDLKRGIKGPVPIPQQLEKIFEEFENSGGAYLMYSAARAGALLRKAEQRGADYSFNPEAVGDSEASLLKKVGMFPGVVSQAASSDNPTSLLNYLLELAKVFNSFYQNSPVITDEGVNNSRLGVVQAVQTVLQNGVRLLGVEPPQRI